MKMSFRFGMALVAAVGGPAGQRDSRAGGTNPILLAWLALVLLTVGGALWFLGTLDAPVGGGRAPGKGTVIEMGIHEMAALDNAWGDRSGFMVWSTTMYGQHDLVRMDWPSGRLTHLTHHPEVEATPRISPDGHRLAFARSRREWVSYANPKNWDVWVLDMRTGVETCMAENGAGPVWTADGGALVFQRGGRELVRVDLATGTEQVLRSAPEKAVWTEPALSPNGDRVAVTTGKKQRGVLILNLLAPGETQRPGFSHLSFLASGAGVVAVEPTGRMESRIVRAQVDGGHVQPLFDSPGYWSLECFPRVSNDGLMLVFGAAREGGDSDTADYEIFVWRIGDPWEDAARVSFHTGNDQWPDIWVQPAP
jgi:Tol biopolymer transport system component